jgi:DNA-binding MarR family transcriptional regulator
MKRNEILTNLINHFFSFDSERGGQEEYVYDEFIGYLNAKSEVQDIEIRKISGENKEFFNYELPSTSREISILIVLMNRYAKWYIKKVLKDSLLHSPDEFSFLISLMTYESLSKSELITRQIMEKTSGTEIINRLVKKGLINESADQNDKRSIRVSITKSGRDEILRILPLMNKVTEIVVGNLSVEEINTLSYLLKKLDHFHNDIYINKRGEELGEIISEIDNRKTDPLGRIRNDRL